MPWSPSVVAWGASLGPEAVPRRPCRDHRGQAGAMQRVRLTTQDLDRLLRRERSREQEALRAVDAEPLLHDGGDDRLAGRVLAELDDEGSVELQPARGEVPQPCQR